MEKKTKISKTSKKSSETKETVKTPSVNHPTEERITRSKSTVLFAVLIFLLGVVIGAFSAKNPFGLLVGKKTQESSKCQTIAKVKINPGKIAVNPEDKPLALSALAYDEQDFPIFSGVSYEWGMSSTTGVGTIRPNNDLATFIPQRIGKGDLFVKATNSCTSEPVIGSIAVVIGDDEEALESTTSAPVE